MQEFDCGIRDMEGFENLVVAHLSRIICGRELKSHISKCLPYKQLFTIRPDPWYVDIANYLVPDRILQVWAKNDKDRFFYFGKFFVWDDPYLLSIVLTSL